MKEVVTITYKKPCEIIKLDKYTRKINMPTLLLMNRSFSIIGRISRYDNWNISLVGNGIDEISFNVHKYANGIQCPVWDDLIDLKIVNVDGFGMFEISVDYTDNTETVKSIHGFSLEVELAQIGLYEFHVNDDDAADMVITEYSKDNYDSEGNFIPTVFYNPTDEKHSLLHRVLADKAPHWNIGYVTPYIALGEDVQPEESSKFQRTYTVDGDSIYDFLTGTVAEESNVIFTFNVSRNETTGKYERTINCYSLCDCIDQENGDVLCKGIGEDTFVFVSKRKLANEITISSNKDNVKNCLRIEGGDDVITDMVRAVNMNGSNYISIFANFQYDDMSEALRNNIQGYQAMMSSTETQDIYYGNGDIDSFINGFLTLKIESELESAFILNICQNNKIEAFTSIYNYVSAPYWYIEVSDNTKELIASSVGDEYISAQSVINNMGIYTRLCNYYDTLAYFESSMMPDVSISETTAEEQYNIMKDALTDENMTVGVSSLNKYDNNLFVGVSNNVEAMANVLIDARYKAEVINETTSYNDDDKDNIYWTGNIRITRAADETDYYPKTEEQINACFDVNINDDELTFTRQKIEKALHKGSMLDIDFDIANMNDEGIRKYFNKYSLNRLKSFYDGYNSCLSILMQMDANSPVRKDMYEKYFNRMRIISNPPTEENPNPVPGVLDIRQTQVDEINTRISDIQKEQRVFQYGGEYNDKTYTPHDFVTYLENDNLYKEFCSYRREDTYTNSNYISDGLSTSECLAKAKELVEAATKEAKKACMLQRTVSTSLNNLFALPEFDKLWDSFALYNYIRVKTEDEILKLRLIGIDFSGDTPENIEVTFSEQIESVDGTIDDLRSIIQQAGSMATSYPSTALQAKQGSDAKNEITDMYTNGLNAAKTMLTNNDNNEVTITQSGILCKRMDDEGYYGDKQLRITGNILALTDNGWKTVKLAIGESVFYNPFTKQYETKHGILASVIVGQLLCGENMFIGNEDGSVQITGDGITISNGVIQSADYDKNEGTGSIIDLTNGNFSFAGGGLTYGGTNELKVRGNIEATSISAVDKYNLYSYGEVLEVLYGEYAPNYGTWNMGLKLDNYTSIEFRQKRGIAIEGGNDNEIHITANSIYLNDNVYSQTSQITTSDRNLKDNITPLTDKHIKFFSLLQPVSFTFIDGTSGRTHIGFISQDVEDAMTKSGLTDLDFAGFCKKVKTIEIKDEDGNTRYEAEKDEHGNPVYVYSLRYEEFIALNTFVIQNLQKENQDIKKRLLCLEEKFDKLA